MEQIDGLVKLALGLIALGGIVVGWLRWGWPLLRARWERERSKDAVLLGTDAVPANPITGEPARPAIPSIAQQMLSLVTKVDEIHHETHHNDGSSIKDAVARLEDAIRGVNARLDAGERRFDRVDSDLAEVKGQVAGELAISNSALAHAAEASSGALRVIEKAIEADPPPDLG